VVKVAEQGGQKGVVMLATLLKVATLLAVTSPYASTTKFKVASKVAKSVQGGW
jgi:hypothetical protein